ncbi:hypothetical protein SUGI_0264580 [Cryptomeria japonica]|nr:hypothetical protein SUGI_0264580 [Cryptomeria japonica]
MAVELMESLCGLLVDIGPFGVDPASVVDGLPDGWPLGLEALNIRVRIMETIRAAELNSFHLATPSFSSLSSSDLDTESTRSFFPDKSITLGTLIGIRTDHTTMHNGSAGHQQAQMQVSQSRCGSTRPKSCHRLRKWKSYMGCMYSNSRIDNSIPSLGQFLEAHRRAGVSFIGASGEENAYVNVMSEEPEVAVSNGDLFLLDGHRNIQSRSNSSRLPASELPAIEENSAGDLTDCSPRDTLGVKRKHRRAHSYNFCLPKVSNILVRMSPGRGSPSGKINHS